MHIGSFRKLLSSRTGSSWWTLTLNPKPYSLNRWGHANESYLTYVGFPAFQQRQQGVPHGAGVWLCFKKLTHSVSSTDPQNPPKNPYILPSLLYIYIYIHTITHYSSFYFIFHYPCRSLYNPYIPKPQTLNFFCCFLYNPICPYPYFRLDLLLDGSSPGSFAVQLPRSAIFLKG